MHHKPSIGRRRSRIGVRGAARLLALLLAIGLGASTFSGAGLSLASVLGYASLAGFGYVPQHCAERADRVQALNGDRIRVCQERDREIGSFFVGRRITGLDRSTILLSVGLPDRAVSFSCCSLGYAIGGRVQRFAPVAFGPVAGPDPLTGAATYAAVDGGTSYLNVVQTVTMSRAASGYHVDFAITNTSGAPLAIRPLVSMPYWSAIEAPSWSTSPSPRSVTASGQLGGGAMTLTSSTAAGSPPISGYTAGRRDVVGYQARPAGAFDGILHPARESDAVAAVEWTDHVTAPLAAGATAHYALGVAIVERRNVWLSLADPSVRPVGGAPTTLAATVSDERGFGGKQLRWWVTGGASGAAVVDGAGHASFAVPARTGSSWVRAYLDTNGDGQRGADEPLASGQIWAPAASPPIAVPPPPPPPVVAAKPRPPRVTLRRVKTQSLRRLARKGLPVSVVVGRAASVSFRLTVPAKVAKRLHLPKRARLLARASVKARKAGRVSVRLKLAKPVARRLRRHTVRATLTVVATDASGLKGSATATVKIKG